MPVYYDYGVSSSNVGALSGVLCLVLFIWAIICLCLIFKKANRHRWEGLIPVWNLWVLFKISGYKKWFRGLFIVPLLWIVVSLIFRLLGSTGAGSSLIAIKSLINRILGICATILPLIAVILLCLGLSKKFSKHWIFSLGLLFLSPIFYGILAFDNSKYSG